jgi:leucyl aminopeptidase
VSWSSRGVGSVAAALYLREFLGDRAEHWAHLDMSAPAWADASEGDLTRGATGWGTRTLLRYLSALDGGQQPGA